MAGETVPPFFIRAEYDGSSRGFADLERAAGVSAERTRRAFERNFEEVGRVIKNAVGAGLTSGGAVDLNVGQYRQAAAEARAYAAALAETYSAAKTLALATGDTSAATRSYIQALSAQTIEARQSASAAEAQAVSYGRLQQALTATASKSSEVAKAFREVYAEQAKAAKAEVLARQYQAGFESVFSPGIGRKAKSASESASVFQEAAALDELRRAEAAAAEAARIHEAAQRAKALGISQGTQSARESAAVFEAAARADEHLTQAAQRAWVAMAQQEAELRRVASAAREAREAQLAAVSAFSQQPRGDVFQGQIAAFKEMASLALSQNRLSGGGLDINVSQYQQAAAAAEAHAIALREVATAAAQVAFLNEDASEATRLYVQAARAAAVEAENAAAGARNEANAMEKLQAELAGVASKTAAVIQRQEGYTTQLFRGADGARASRFATIQLNQQLQDITVSLASGQNAFVVFSQQIPQAAFAMLGFGGTIGKVAAFLTGGWGTAIFAAFTALGFLLSRTSEAEKKTYDLIDAFEYQKMSMEELAKATRDLADAQDKSNRSSYEAEQLAYRNAKAALAYAIAKRQSLQADLEEEQRNLPNARMVAGAEGVGFAESGVNEAQKALDLNQQAIKNLERLTASASIPVLIRNAEAAADPIKAITLRYDELTSAVKRKVSAGKIDEAEGERQYAELLRAKEGEIKAVRDSEKANSRSSRSAIAGAKEQISVQAKLNKIIEDSTDQPTRVEKANKTLIDINALVEKLRLTGRLTAEINSLAEQAKALVSADLYRPFSDYVKDQERSLQIQRLLLEGRDVEADALRNALRLQDEVGKLDEARLATVLRLAQAQQDMADALEDQRARTQAYVDTVGDIRQAFENALLGSGNFAKGLKDAFKNLSVRLVSNQLFGGLEREIQRMVNGPSGLDVANDNLAKGVETTKSALDTLVEALQKAASDIAGASSAPGLGYDPSVFDTEGDVTLGGDPVYGDIVVTAKKAGGELEKGADAAAAKAVSAADAFGSIINISTRRMIAQLEKMIGLQLPAQLSGALSGGLTGYATGGVPGALIGVAKSFAKTGSKLEGTLGKMGEGAQTGTMVAGIGKMLGLKMSTTGSQIGGAIGQAIGGPIGGLVGSLAGGLIGGLFKKTKKGTATLGYNADGTLGVVSTAGNSNSRIQAATEAGNSVIESLQNIADQLGGDVGGPISVSIGVRKKNYRVDPTGQGNTKTSKGAVDFGQDAEAALKYAIADAIKDGAITGLRAATKTLISKGNDIEVQLQKALDFENVFRELRQFKDPVGAAIDDLNREFERLKKIFAEAGASSEEYAQLEELYGIKRAEAIKQATEAVSNTLRQLLDDLTTKNDARSLRERLTFAQAAYNPLAADLKAGKTVDYDAFAQAARDILEIQREMSGSQDGYFQLLNEITSLTSKALADQQNVVSLSSATASPFDNSVATSTTSPANDNTSVVSAINATSADQVAQLATMNQTLSKLLATWGIVRGGTAAIAGLNF